MFKDYKYKEVRILTRSQTVFLHGISKHQNKSVYRVHLRWLNTEDWESSSSPLLSNSLEAFMY